MLFVVRVLRVFFLGVRLSLVWFVIYRDLEEVLNAGLKDFPYKYYT